MQKFKIQPISVEFASAQFLSATISNLKRAYFI
jgi:hypothetical protein